MHILHIDSSIQGELSVSRRLSAAVVQHLRAASASARVTYRDLASEPLPQFSAPIVEALFGGRETRTNPEAAALAQALQELLDADIVVLGAPMYNFTVPSQLKSWLDAIAVPGKTFRYGADGVEGLLGGKRVVVASARGGLYAPDSPGAMLEHHENYLRAFFSFLGVTRLEVVRAEGVRVSREMADQAIQAALEQAARLEAA